MPNRDPAMAMAMGPAVVASQEPPPPRPPKLVVDRARGGSVRYLNGRAPYSNPIRSRSTASRRGSPVNIPSGKVLGSRTSS